MATADQVRDEILLPMRALYRVPFGIENPENALAQYAAVLHRYRTPTLTEGWGRLIKSYKRRDWPSISEIVEVLDAVEREARDAIAAATAPSQPKAPEIDHLAIWRQKDFERAVDIARWRIRSNLELQPHNGFSPEEIAEAHRRESEAMSVPA